MITLSEFSSKRPYLFLVLAVAIAQATYWFVLSPPNQRTAIPSEMIVGETQAAHITSPTLTDIADAEWEDVKAGYRACCDTRFMAFRFYRDLETLPEADFGLIAGVNADNYRIWVNGFPVFDKGELAPNTTYDGRQLRGVMRVSHAMLRQGQNEILIIAARATPDHISVYRHAFGDYATLIDTTRKRAFMTGPFRYSVTILFGVITLFGVALTPMSKHGGMLFWLTLLTGAYFADNALSYWAGNQIPPLMRTFGSHAIEFLAPVALIGFIESWSGGNLRYVRYGAIGVYILSLALLAIAIFQYGHAGHEFVATTADFLYFAGGISSIAIFAWHLPRGLVHRPWEVATLSVLMTAMIGEVVAEFILQTSRNYVSYALPYVITAFIIAISSRNIRIYDTMAAFNQSLNKKLATREKEITAFYAKIRETQRERDIAEERQRIMRDMHDGVGGQLVSLLARAKQDDLKPKDIVSAISDSLADLRLMVNSLDSVGDSLDMALARFQEKIRPMLAERNIQLEWENRLDNPAPEFPTRAVLNIFRTLQEAVSNATNHSGTTLIRVSISQIHDAKLPLQIIVEDNGKGFDVSKAAGKGSGLGNMLTRARLVGGELTINSSSSVGTRVLLSLPSTTHPDAAIEDAQLQEASS